MNKTKIEWVKNPDGSQGYTLNSKTGCTNHTPEGLCLGGLFPCYAFKVAHARLKPLYLANSNWCHWNPPENGYYDPFYPRFWENRLLTVPARPDTEPKGKGIFLDDMSDWMLDCWRSDQTRAELQMMREHPWHRFYTLTKQPQNLIKFLPFPDNCWVGVTATNDATYMAALEGLRDITAKVKFISFEPLLEEVINNNRDHGFCNLLSFCFINWLIIGACTGTKKDMEELCRRYPNLILIHWRGNIWTAQPKIEDLMEIVEAADKAGIPVFLKDNLKPLFGVMTSVDVINYGNLNKSYLLEEITFNEDNQIIAHKLRQELPSIPSE